MREAQSNEHLLYSYDDSRVLTLRSPDTSADKYRGAGGGRESFSEHLPLSLSLTNENKFIKSGRTCQVERPRKARGSERPRCVWEQRNFRCGWMPGDVGETTREQAWPGVATQEFDWVLKAVGAGGDFKTYELDEL